MVSADRCGRFDIETAKALGSRIRDRGDRTQADFAAVISVDRATLANYESGRRLPNDATVKKLAELSGRTVPELLFGSPMFNYKAVSAAIEEQIAKEASKRPGTIPRWSISDDEIAAVIALRLAMSREGGLELVRNLVAQAELVVAQDRDTTGLPVYGEGHLTRLRDALSRRF
jgi:transcriptional regulator with XRE-family HTH domain